MKFYKDIYRDILKDIFLLFLTDWRHMHPGKVGENFIPFNWDHAIIALMVHSLLINYPNLMKEWIQEQLLTSIP